MPNSKMPHQSHSFEPGDRHTQRRIQDFLILKSFAGVPRRWGSMSTVQWRPVQSRPNRKSSLDHSSKMHLFYCFLMQNVCNTNSRILIQQTEKFIFLGILVLGLQCTRPVTTPVECGPTTPEAVYTRHRTATELDINLAPGYCLGWVHILYY